MSQINMLVLAIVALQAADAATTYLVVRRGKGFEANVILAYLFTRLGMIPTLLLVKGIFIAVLIWGAPQIPLPILVLMFVCYFWVIVNNINVLKK